LLEVGVWAHLRIVGPGLKVAKVPAQRAGWGELYAFLQRGYRAGRELKDLQGFVATIVQRELRLLDLMYSGDLAGFVELARLS
jgi:hypothetical protein